MTDPFQIAGDIIERGEMRRLEIPVARLPTHTMLHLPVTIAHGDPKGPRLWLSAALHGDEINGMEIVRRILNRVAPKEIRGTLVAAPIVNVFGFINQSRYLPDRRDLNRSFPGSRRGSLASRLAHLFMTEIVARCTHGIDLHSASPPRINLPQVRANLEDPETRRCAEAFAAPVMLHSSAPKGSLRGAAAKLGKPVLLYEAGEPYRFNSSAIEVGVEGVLRVMAELGMIPNESAAGNVQTESKLLRKSRWIRAPQSGIFYLEVELGQSVGRKERLGVITDPFGETARKVVAPFEGLVISHTNRPLVHRGDGILHIAAGNSDE